MTPSGIEPAAFRFVAQNLNRCAAAVPIAVIQSIATVTNRKPMGSLLYSEELLI
jgi:hypothetical protein